MTAAGLDCPLPPLRRAGESAHRFVTGVGGLREGYTNATEGHFRILAREYNTSGGVTWAATPWTKTMSGGGVGDMSLSPAKRKVADAGVDEQGGVSLAALQAELRATPSAPSGGTCSKLLAGSSVKWWIGSPQSRRRSPSN